MTLRLIYMFLGICITLPVIQVRDWGMRGRYWEEAFEHHAAMYYWNDGKITKWMWLDDYFREKYSPPITPQPKWEKL